MRAKFVYEKFSQDSDPIKDLGIGLIPRHPISKKEYEEADFHNMMNVREFLDYMYKDFNHTHFGNIIKLSKNN